MSCIKGSNCSITQVKNAWRTQYVNITSTAGRNLTFVHATFSREFQRKPPPQLSGMVRPKRWSSAGVEEVTARDGVGEKRAVEAESGILNIRIQVALFWRKYQDRKRRQKIEPFHHVQSNGKSVLQGATRALGLSDALVALALTGNGNSCTPGGGKGFQVLFTVCGSLALSPIAYKSLINIATCEYKSYKHGVLFHGCGAHRASRVLWSASAGLKVVHPHQAELKLFHPCSVVGIIIVVERN